MSSRIQKLEFLLTQMDKIHLRDASEILNVSEMTIRRDLNADETKSLALLGGYIVKDPQKNKSYNYQIFEHQGKNIAEKMQIGKIAASLIENGDIVFFDCGSTIPFIASQIDNNIEFTAICCSLNTFLILQEKANCEIYLAGGKYSRHNSFFSTISTNTDIDKICTTKAFISAAGVDAVQGITCFNFEEAKTKVNAIKKTQKPILVFDHSKVGLIKQAYIADINKFSLIITDRRLPKEFDQNLPLKTPLHVKQT